MNDPGTTVDLWCAHCHGFVPHRAAFVTTGRGPTVLHVTPEQLAEHRATHRKDHP